MASRAVHSGALPVCRKGRERKSRVRTKREPREGEILSGDGRGRRRPDPPDPGLGLPDLGPAAFVGGRCSKERRGSEEGRDRPLVAGWGRRDREDRGGETGEE